MTSSTLLSLSSLLVVILAIPACTGTQLCVDSCSVDHDFDGNFTLPLNCTFVQRDQCDVLITFDYSARIIHFQFGTLSQSQQRDPVVYTSDNIAHTTITLDGDSNAQHIIEYYCSTGDACEYKYAVDEALPLYKHKTCHLFRAKIISLLHSEPSSTSRACIVEDGTEKICAYPCELFYTSPNQTLRSCDAQRSLEFQTTVGRSTPTNKPEYTYRLYAYACTNQGCNGYTKQDAIEKLMREDDGECLIFLDNNNQTTSTPGSTATSTQVSHADFVSYPLMVLLHFLFLLLL